MALKEINPKLFELDGKYRMEVGPPLVHAVATEKLLSDEVTARHYKEGALDAKNKTIVIGEEMDFLDWKNKGKWVWYMYALKPVEKIIKKKVLNTDPPEYTDEKVVEDVWIELEQFPGSQKEAAAQLKKLAKKDS